MKGSKVPEEFRERILQSSSSYLKASRNQTAPTFSAGAVAFIPLEARQIDESLENSRKARPILNPEAVSLKCLTVTDIHLFLSLKHNGPLRQSYGSYDTALQAIEPLEMNVTLHPEARG